MGRYLQNVRRAQELPLLSILQAQNEHIVSYLAILTQFIVNWNEQRLKYAVLLYAWAEFLWEFYLLFRQYRRTSIIGEVPEELKSLVNNDSFNRAREYTAEKLKFGICVGTVGILITTGVISLNFLSLMWDYAKAIVGSLNREFPFIQETEVYISIVWVALLFTIETLVNLPLVIYQTFGIEQRFGFNKQSMESFILNTIVFFLIANVLNCFVSAFLVVLIKKGGDNVFWWLWLSIATFSIILIILYPTYISPLFNNYKPLPDGELKRQVEKLADENGFPKDRIFVVECSDRTTHGNAYFFGLFKSNSIVLYDTLINGDSEVKFSNDEILAVLAHEMGHWKYNHVTKYLVITQISLFFSILIFSRLIKTDLIYRAFGFLRESPVLAGFIITTEYIMAPYNLLLNFLLTCISRRYEFQADQFAVNLGKSNSLRGALCKLHKNNLGYPIYDSLYSTWYLSHPPLLERLKEL